MSTVTKRVSRSELRQNQSAVLNRVSKEGRILVMSRLANDSPVYLVDQKYLDQLTRDVESIVETLEILMDKPLASRLQKIKRHASLRPRSLKLVPFDDVFANL